MSRSTSSDQTPAKELSPSWADRLLGRPTRSCVTTEGADGIDESCLRDTLGSFTPEIEKID